MLKILELFAGIGACSTALDRLGIEHEIVDAVEVDRWALRSFNAIHGTNFETQDIRLWDKDIECDLIMHGSPCQDFSIAGKQAGGDEHSGTRSSLMYETLRIVEKIRPRYVIWENVKNILSRKHRHNFDNYLERMKQLGYRNYYQVLNAKDYGIPQNRERVFTISIRNDTEKEFVFPKKQELKLKLRDMLEDQVEEKYYLSDKLIQCFSSNGTGNYPRGERFRQNLERKNQDIANSIITTEGNKPTCNFVVGKIPQWKERGNVFSDTKVVGTLCATDYKTPKLVQVQQQEKVINNLRIRKLTPKECWRLMGFTDEEFEKAAQHNSNSQLYKQAGNSIVVNVLEKVLLNLLGGLANDK